MVRVAPGAEHHGAEAELADRDAGVPELTVFHGHSRSSCRRGRLVVGGGPAAEEVERLLGAGAGFGGVGEERQPGVGGDVEAVEAEAELADDGVVEVLDGGGVEAHVVRGPVGAERLALGGELADEV